MEEKTTYTVPKANIVFLKERIEKLNKKAVKLGIEPITYKIIREFSVPAQIGFDGTILVPIKYYYEVELISEHEIHLPGWELVAVITPVGNENLVKTVPDKTVPDTYRTTTMICEHCNKIRNRKDVFVMHNTETGEYKQIGRQCTQDFLGNDPSRIFQRATWIRDIESMMEDVDELGYGCGKRGSRAFGLEELLNLACAVIRKTGYWSVKATKDMEGKDSTYSSVLFLLSPSWNKDNEADKKRFIAKWGIEVEDCDIAQATAVIEWAKQIPADTTNNYFYNLGVSARLGYATDETAALMVSAIEAYRKEIEKVTYEKKEKKESNWVGEVGKRIVVTGVKQVYRMSHDGDYGIRSLIKLEQVETGNILVWWASGYVDMESDEPFDIKCTIKKHQEYKDSKQTLVNRVVDLTPEK